jgi:uncharacterized protein (TIGR00251 family)
MNPARAAAALDLRADGDGCLIRVKVAPRGSSDAVLGAAEGALRIRLTAPPVDGAANAAARDFLAGLLGVSRSAVSLIRGPAARAKVFRAAGLAPDAVRERLAPHLRT